MQPASIKREGGLLWRSEKAALSRPIPSALQFQMKRALDLILVLSALIFLLPFLLIVALAIKLDSPGPVFFVQERVGAKRRAKNGKTVWEISNFQIYKFRTMHRDTDSSEHQMHIKAFVEGTLDETDAEGAPFKIQEDPRITRAGRILRKTSLDELPQLFNVLKGEMSLVGPRPVPTYEVAEYLDWHYERLAALPGLTGLWQVYGRGRVTFDDMVRMDLQYVRHPSLRMDLKLLLLTIPAVLSGRGAK